MRGIGANVAWVMVPALVLAACGVDEPDEPVEPEDPADPEDQAAAEPEQPAAPEEPREQRRAAELPVPRTEVTGAVWDGRVVAVGGLDTDGAALSHVHFYDPVADAWDEGPELPAALHHTAVETLGERVYVVGGYAIQGGAWVAESAVWSLGPGEEQWREEPPLPTPRGALAVAASGNRLVAIGGVDPAGQVLDSTEVLEAGADAWESGPQLTTPREHLDATAVGDQVYAIAGRAGGFDTNRSSVEVLRDGAWGEAPSLQHSRGGIGADTVDGMPCVTGGEEPAGTIATVECLTGDGWEVVAQLEVARHGLVVAALDSELHVVGGGREPGLSVSAVHEVVPITLP